MKNCLFVISRAVAEKLISEELLPNQSPFYVGEYLGFISKRGYLTPATFKKIGKKFEGKGSLKHIKSIVRDGGEEVGATTTFDDEHKDVFFLCGFLDITVPDERVVVIIAKEEQAEFEKCLFDYSKEVLDEIYKNAGSADISFEVIPDNEFFTKAKERDREFANHVDLCFSGSY